MRPNSINIRLPWIALESWFQRFMERRDLQPASPRIGLVLSSGGARGLAHVGAIQVLEEAKIPITAIIGSSMGAYVGALWAAGISGKGLEELAAEIKDRRKLLRLLDPAMPPTRGFLRGEKIRNHLARTLGEMTIEQLQKRMFIIATNLDTVSSEVLPANTPVATAVQASSAIPGICAPVQLNGNRYIDGGASQPLPVTLLKKLVKLDYVIAVNVMPTKQDISSCDIKSFPAKPESPKSFGGRLWASCMSQVNLFAYGNVLDTFKRCLTSAQLRLMAEESEIADVVIHPYFCESKWYDFENFDRYIEAGRLAAEVAMPRIRELMKLSNHKNPHHETVPSISTMGCGRT